MDIADFKAGHFTNQYQYRSFTPSEMNHPWTWSDARINTLLAEANRKLGELNAYSLTIPHVDIFVWLHKLKEATTSSRIEGTQTNLETAVLAKGNVDPEKRRDWEEVHNYIAAMNHCIEQLATLPVSTRLLKEAHAILLRNVRGEHKFPGEYRTSPNWIGGVSLADAVFIPPHHEEIGRLMSDLEQFLHNEEIDVPELVRVALAHYQFETIHPFLDGNGRIGRLLITLYLVSKGLLIKPTLYLSEYFERHRQLYYDNLMIVRTQNNLGQWLKFFLTAVVETCTKGSATFQKILRLKEEVEGKRIVKLGRKAARAKELMDVLYRNPSVAVADVEKHLRVSAVTANGLIQDFVRLGILVELTGYKRNRLFMFQEYMNLF